MPRTKTSNEKAMYKGLKAVEDLGILAPAILRERLLTLCSLNITQIKADPEKYNNAVFNSNQYIDVLETFVKELDF